MKKALPVAAAVLALALPAAAAAAPAPFGHACTPRSGVRFCPSTTSLVPSFDGVPLDVDVTLPATGNGPFPTIAMLHGLGGNKRNFEGTKSRGYNNVFYARHGYAVVTPSARGSGRSCGPTVPHTGACARGWTHLADQRYEVRDVQYLLGLLVDENVADAGALGATGVSYGGGQSQELARLRNRIRLPNGSFRPWQSPRGVPLSLRAAWPRWGWSDLTYALTPNGRFADFRAATPRQSRSPLGVEKESYVNGLYTVDLITSFLAPIGADPTADLTGWLHTTNAGEPYGAAATSLARELTTYHSATSLGGVPAPTLLQNGWTDDLFPAPEALRYYEAEQGVRGAHVSLQLGDFGHSRGANKPGENTVTNRQGLRFFDAWLKGRGRKPRDGSVLAFTQTCPVSRPAGGPYRARSWAALHPRRVRFGSRRTQRITSSGGSPAVGKAYDQTLTAKPCLSVRARRSRGTAVYQRRTRRPYTLLGLPTVRATIHTHGRYGEIAARLWDVFHGRQRLVTRGVYRLRPDQKGRIAFELFGNGWRFRRGHVARLELLGSDPHYLRPSNGRFRVRIRDARVSLPVR